MRLKSQVKHPALLRTLAQLRGEICCLALKKEERCRDSFSNRILDWSMSGLINQMHIYMRSFPRSLCKCCGFFKYTEKTFVFNKLRMDIICVVCKPHYLSVASAQGYHTCYYMCMTLGGAITLDLTCRPGLCIIQWKYIILNGRCWMTFAFICNYADAFLPKRNTRKDYSFLSGQRGSVCVSLRQRESG